MATFVLVIETDNAAFEDALSHEILRIAARAAKLVESGHNARWLRDANGNRCGWFNYPAEQSLATLLDEYATEKDRN